MNKNSIDVSALKDIIDQTSKLTNAFTSQIRGIRVPEEIFHSAKELKKLESEFPRFPEISNIHESFIPLYNSIQDRMKNADEGVKQIVDLISQLYNESKNNNAQIVEHYRNAEIRAQNAEKGNRIALKIAVAALVCTGIGAVASVVAAIYTVLTYYQ